MCPSLTSCNAQLVGALNLTAGGQKLRPHPHTWTLSLVRPTAVSTNRFTPPSRGDGGALCCHATRDPYPGGSGSPRLLDGAHGRRSPVGAVQLARRSREVMLCPPNAFDLLYLKGEDLRERSCRIVSTALRGLC